MSGRKVNNYVKWWLLTGVILLFFQIFIGGVTRLTGSGLSITRWEIVTGTIPPLTDNAWKVEFEKYKQTPQYAKINQGMIVQEFKFIYFWEYFHRLWAKMIGVVFLIPFFLFWFRSLLPKFLLKDLGITVGLAMVAASFGWIMVASGLVNRPWVNAYKLSVHLVIGISVFAYLFWTFLKYSDMQFDGRTSQKGKVNMLLLSIFLLLIVQVIFGGWMSGMKAALFYPTWPKIGESYIPQVLLDLNNFNLSNIRDYESGTWAISLVHFLHRSLAYVIIFLLAFYALKKSLWGRNKKLSYSFYCTIILVTIQVILGIATLLTSIGKISVGLGSMHQSVAVLLLTAIIYHIYQSLKIEDLNEKLT